MAQQSLVAQQMITTTPGGTANSTNNNLYALPTPLWTPNGASGGGVPTMASVAGAWMNTAPLLTNGTTTVAANTGASLFDLGPVLQQAGFTIQGIFRPAAAVFDVSQQAQQQPQSLMSAGTGVTNALDMRYCALL